MRKPRNAREEAARSLVGRPYGPLNPMRYVIRRRLNRLPGPSGWVVRDAYIDLQRAKLRWLGGLGLPMAHPKASRESDT